MSYQLSIDKETTFVKPLNTTATICFSLSPNNADYQQFVRDIKNGVQLNDANGNAITGTELTTFISTLP
jgi:hypothetical protein